MGLSDVHSFLQRHHRLAFDTSIFIYQIQENPTYVKLTHHLFTWLQEPSHLAVTSTITMAELLVQPYQMADEQRVNKFYGLLSAYPNLEWLAPTLEIADVAARLRAVHRLRTPDALQVATAVHSQATGFVTNDLVFRRVVELETMVLDEHL